jgi:flagellar biosynthesis/type III secretory pathway protein FliH
MKSVSTIFLLLSIPLLAVAQDDPQPEQAEEKPAAETSSETDTPADTLLTEIDPTAPVPESDEDYINLPGEPLPDGFDDMPSDDLFAVPNEFVPPPAPAIDPAALAAASQERERKLDKAYVRARTEAEKDPSLIPLLEQARTATTFEAERAAYRAYYRGLFAKIRKLDKSLSERCDKLEEAYLRRLAQTRLEPTIPLEPPPKPEPLAN